MSLSRCASSFALLVGSAAGARISKHRSGMQAEDYVVLFNEGATNADISAFCGGSCPLMGHPDQGGVAFAAVKGKSQMDSLMAQPSAMTAKISLVEPDEEDHIFEDIRTESEPELASWGIVRAGVSTRTNAGRGQTIYIQDTGIRSSHSDFGGRSSPAIDLTGGSVEVCSSGSTTCALDGHGHGTHCAGTAAGATYGLASEATLKAMKTLSDQGSGSRSWQFAAIDWVTTSGVKPSVISMSLGGSGADAGYTTSIGAASNAGITVVVAAGNSNADACNFSPAFTPLAITVGSTDSLTRRSSFSNYGSCVQFWAPGSSILSAGISSDTSSATMSGTSMACPHVSGAAALVLERNPTFLAPQVLEELLATAYTDEITGLYPSDTNKELYVGAGGAPTPVPTPAPPPGTWEVTSGTGCTKTGNCIQSNNHPASYGNNEECFINAYEVDLTVEAFSTESGYDILSMGGTQYSGTSGPAGGAFSGVISWASDYSEVSSGWKLCHGSSPGPVPTPAPTTQSPTPAPTTPAPTTPAPSPPSPPAPTPPSSGNCSSWCEPPADCVDYPYSCSGCCDGSPSPSPSPPAPSPPSSGDCLSICDRESDCTGYPSICGGCSFC